MHFHKGWYSYIFMSSCSYADNNVRRTSADSQDTTLLTNFEVGGLTGLEAKYY